MKMINYLLGYRNMKIVQDPDMFKFSLDSVLLANFVTLNPTTKNILDIGTGNAPIPLIMSLKTSAHIDSIEIQKEVYELGKESIEINKKEKQIRIINEDVNEWYKEEKAESYDLITSNPPYFKYNDKSIKNKNDYKSIARHEIKLNLQQILLISRKLLKNGGILSMVHRPDRLLDILVEMRENNIEPKRIQFVYPKKGEESNILLIEGIKNGKPGLKVLDPIYVYDENNNYTDEVLNYFTN